MTLAATAADPEAVDTGHFGAVPVRRRDCPLCGRDNGAAPLSRYSLPPWAIRHCPECRFVYIDKAVRHEAQFNAMAWERTTKIEERRRAQIRPLSYKASKRLRFRMRLLPRRTMLGFIAARLDGGNVLDLGCGDGHALRDFPASFTPFGIEISSGLAAAAHEAFAARGGYAVNAACVKGLAQFPAGFFAAASLRSYLEHEADPLPVLHGLRRVLMPGGFAVVKVPNYASLNRAVMGRRWCGFRYPDHLNYFTPASLRALAAKAGFATRFGPTGHLPTGDNMWAVLS
ncbi:MAG TPA: class I SAM-dependent methyltransferase [Stellaceae bacterium]|nr:class I SAM-dependent methyltransferase [Stellaceae bacterium]